MNPLCSKSFVVKKNKMAQTHPKQSRNNDDETYPLEHINLNQIYKDIRGLLHDKKAGYTHLELSERYPYMYDLSPTLFFMLIDPDRKDYSQVSEVIRRLTMIKSGQGTLEKHQNEFAERLEQRYPHYSTTTGTTATTGTTGNPSTNN